MIFGDIFGWFLKPLIEIAKMEKPSKTIVFTVYFGGTSLQKNLKIVKKINRKSYHPKVTKSNVFFVKKIVIFSRAVLKKEKEWNYKKKTEHIHTSEVSYIFLQFFCHFCKKKLATCHLANYLLLIFWSILLDHYLNRLLVPLIFVWLDSVF